MVRTSRRFHPYTDKKHPIKASIKHHRRVLAHFSSGMEVDSGHTESAKKRQRAEAHMVPGLGPLEWGFPNSIITTLRYVKYASLTSTAGATTSQVFRANGCYDPDYTGVGHQPMFFDQWAAIYNYYTVIGSKITVEVIGGSATTGFNVALQGSSTNSLSSDSQTHSEQNNTVCTMIGTLYTGSKVLTMTYSPLEHMGQEVKDDGSSMTAVSADPTAGEGTYYYGLLAASNTAVALENNVLYYRATIEYTVKFTELSKNSGS